MELPLALIVAAAVTVGLLAAVYLWRRDDAGLVVAGFRRGLLAGLVIFAATTLVVTLALIGRPFLFGDVLDLGGSLRIGLFIGAALAIGFVWIGLALAAIGMLIRPNEMWAKFGAWVAVPIVVIAAGFGLASFGAYEQEQRKPTETGGTATVSLSGVDGGDVDDESEAVTCRYHRDGTFGVDAEFSVGEPTFTSVLVILGPDSEVEVLTVSHAGVNAVSGRGFDPEEVAELLTKTDSTGEIRFTNVVPLTADNEPDPVERWSGSFSWTCSR